MTTPNSVTRNDGAIGFLDGGVGSPSASSAADSGSKSSMSMSISALSSWATSESIATCMPSSVRRGG
jgi:hypothetical protein